MMRVAADGVKGPLITLITMIMGRVFCGRRGLAGMMRVAADELKGSADYADYGARVLREARACGNDARGSGRGKGSADCAINGDADYANEPMYQ
jgi:hypothetical protein